VFGYTCFVHNVSLGLENLFAKTISNVSLLDSLALKDDTNAIL